MKAVVGAIICWVVGLGFPGVLCAQEAAGAEETSAATSSDPRASSPERDVVLWRVIGEPHAGLEAELKTILDRNARHLLTAEELEAYVHEQPSVIPGCYSGLNDCSTSQALVVDALRLAMVIHVDVSSRELAAGSTVFQAEFEVLDRRGMPIRGSRVVQPSLQRLADDLVREIFDATGVIVIETVPPGATVWMEKIRVGTSPIEKRLPIGTYQIELQLDGHRAIQEAVRIPNGRSTRSRFRLLEMPGRLEIPNLAAGTVVSVRDQSQVSTSPGETLTFELIAGRYIVTAERDGHLPQQFDITIERDQATVQTIELEKQTSLLKDFDEPIESFPYTLGIGLEFLWEYGTHRDARTETPEELEFIGFERAREGAPLRAAAPGGVGLRMDMTRWGEHWGLTPLSLSYHQTNPDERGVVVDKAGAEIPVVLTELDRLQIRPLQVSARFPFQNLVPTLSSGIGFEVSWLTVTGTQWPEPVTLRATDSFFHLSGGVHYYLTPQWAGWAQYGYQTYFDVGDDSDHLFAIGVSGSLSSLPLLDDRPPETL